MKTGLAKYDAARHALQEAHTIDEVKDVRDKAEAMRLYAQQAKDVEMASWAAEIKLRAERKAGELIKDMQASGELASKGQPPKETSQRARLKEHDISWSDSSRWQQEAKVPEEKFEEYIAESKAKGDVPTAAGLRRLNRDERKARKQEENEELREASVGQPMGCYSVIVMDPPWPMEKIGRDVRPNQVAFDYPTMSEEELAAFDVPSLAADDCHLFCWTTQKFLPMTLRLLEGWGFRYVLTMVWHKPGGPQPFGLPQYNCEFAVYARKGTPEFTDLKAFSCCFQADRREHSRKPAWFYALVNRVTNGPRIDVFSREQHDGFDQFGNEADKFEAAS